MSDSVIDKIISRASNSNKRVVLPEADDQRVIKAVRTITERHYAELILLGAPEEILRLGKKLDVDLSGVEIIDHLKDPDRPKYIDRLYERRKAKGASRQDIDDLLKHKVYYGGMMVGAGKADGMVAGCTCPTGNTVLAAIYGVGMPPDNKLVSACSVINTIIPTVGVGGTLIFADTGVIPEPTAEQLAYIAIAAAEACRTLLKATPYVAMLSFSTKGSARSAAARKVVDATKLAQSMRPDLKIDGELQLDAAVIPEVAQRKAPDSPVAGRANTLIFPDLSSGNIGYKLVERLSKATALGPLLQGLVKPVNDLSRGCSVEDIILITAITAAQALETKS